MSHLAAAPAAGARATGTAPLVAFFALAYALTWVFWIPAGLQTSGRISLPLPAWAFELLGGLGPMLAAMLLAALHGGGAAVARLFRPVLAYRVPARWYLVVFLVIPLMGLTDVWAALLYGQPIDVENLPPLLAIVPVHFVFVALVGGGLDEELGWRGFALPRLQVRLDPTAASLLLGVLWSCWHLPLWFIPGTFQSEQSFALYLLGTTASSVLLGWILNGTGGSLLLVILAHAAMDATDNVRSNLLASLPIDVASELHVLRVGVDIAVALALVAATQGRLGFAPGRGTGCADHAPGQDEPG